VINHEAGGRASVSEQRLGVGPQAQERKLTKSSGPTKVPANPRTRERV